MQTDNLSSVRALKEEAELSQQENLNMSAAWCKEHFDGHLKEQGTKNINENLLTLKKEAFAAFDKTGFPSSKEEAWKYTNLQPVVKNEFTPSKNISAISKDEIEKYLIGEKRQVIVFINGFYSEALSKECSNFEDSSLEISSISNLVCSSDSNELISKFEKVSNDDSLVSFNTAFFNDGLHINVPENYKAEVPVQIVFVNSSTSAREVSHSRLLIELQKNSSLEVFEQHFGKSDSEYMTSSLGQVFLNENSKLSHVKVQQESEKACILSTLKVHQEKNTDFSSTLFSFGGGLVRNEIYPSLEGEDIDSTINGLTVLSGKQHVDNYTLIDHAKANCESNELFKGIYAGSSRGVFGGTIIVRPDSQKTNAIQSNQSILLSDDCSIETRPQLKIWADDVKCTHGATIGQLDEEALFYLRSRGISKEESKQILVDAFATDVIDELENEELVDYLKTALRAKLASIVA